MKMSDMGWVWEGHGLDPGVHPSIFGVGEGADFFGLRKVRLMFHPNNELTIGKLRDKEEVVCDISKWRFRDCGEGGGGSETYGDADIESVCAEAEKVSRFSLQFPNITGGYYDDMKGLLERTGGGVEQVDRVRETLKKHNPDLRLESVVYAHELAEGDFWAPLVPYIDIVSFWVWGYPNLDSYEADLERCRERFPDKPIRAGCYLRDYPSKSPMPMESIRRQWHAVLKALEDGTIQAFDILGTVLIDGQLEQATWVRDFIRDHS